MGRKLAEAEAGARFDAAMIIFKKAWAEHYPSEPFVVDGVVTPKAMEYVRGYVDGLKRAREEPRRDGKEFPVP